VAVTPDGKTVFVGNANLVGEYVDPGDRFRRSM
jgi:hypothetical protein